MSTATLRSESKPMARIDRAIEPLLDGQLIYYMGSPGTTNISTRGKIEKHKQSALPVAFGMTVGSLAAVHSTFPGKI